MKRYEHWTELAGKPRSNRTNQGTLYPVLLRLEQEGAILSEWGASENNRRARFYRLTRAGQKLLHAETRDWEQTAAIVAFS
jgi:PadR family transcriptional regulator PadR